MVIWVKISQTEIMIAICSNGLIGAISQVVPCLIKLETVVIPKNDADWH